MQKTSSNPKTKTSKKSTVKDVIPHEELDPRWANFLDLYIKSGKPKQSALQAGFSESYASVIMGRFPEKVKQSLAEALEAKGITSERIAESIDFLLDSDEYQAVDKGITHAAKIGVGGGYAAEKSIHVNVNLENRKHIEDVTERASQELLHEELGNG